MRSTSRLRSSRASEPVRWAARRAGWGSCGTCSAITRRRGALPTSTSRCRRRSCSPPTASIFSKRAKAYLRATPYSLEEEKMAVLLQRVVGERHGSRYYPDFSGVARSHNFYPSPPFTSEDGVAAVALGMGRTVVEGEQCLLFCPRYPQHLVHVSSVDDMLTHSQRDFWALELDHGGDEEAMRETRFGIDVAEADGTLSALGSTYSPETHAVYDGIARSGVRLVTFAPMLKHRLFQLAEMLAD